MNGAGGSMLLKLGRVVSFEVDHYLEFDVMSKARRLGMSSNAIVAFYGVISGFTADRHRWTIDVSVATMSDNLYGLITTVETHG